MNKKVLIISSSPRKKGNSDLLCDEFMRGAKEAGNIVEKVFLNELNIHYCNACGYCVKHIGECSIKDDMYSLKEKIINADVIVLGSPVYFYTMSAQLKTFIDRHAFFYSFVKDKEFYYIMTSADTNKGAMQTLLEEFHAYAICLSGSKEKGAVYGVDTWDKGDVSNRPVMHEAYQMGLTI